MLNGNNQDVTSAAYVKFLSPSDRCNVSGGSDEKKRISGSWTLATLWSGLFSLKHYRRYTIASRPIDFATPRRGYPDNQGQVHIVIDDRMKGD